MYPPKEFYNPADKIIWKLNKAIYGLRSSPKAWQNHLAQVLKQLGLQRSAAEPNIYFTSTRDCFVLVYVDDLLFLGEEQVTNQLFTAIQQQLLLRPTGTLTPGNTVSFLGRNITNRGDHYEISLNDDYTTTLLREMNLQRQQTSTSTRDISIEDSNSRPRTGSFTRRACAISTSSRETSMDDLHQARHQLCNKGVSTITAAANNSWSTKAEASTTLHQRNKTLQADHPTNSKNSTTSHPRSQRFCGQRLGRMSTDKTVNIGIRDHTTRRNNQLRKQNTGDNSIVERRGRALRDQHRCNWSITSQKPSHRAPQREQGQHQDPHRLFEWQEHGNTHRVIKKGQTHWPETSIHTTTDPARLRAADQNTHQRQPGRHIHKICPNRHPATTPSTGWNHFPAALPQLTHHLNSFTSSSV